MWLLCLGGAAMAEPMLRQTSQGHPSNPNARESGARGPSRLISKAI